MEIYTDGACKRNPGHAGSGAVLVINDYVVQLHEYCGVQTNNYAELYAIKIALDYCIKFNHTSRLINLHSDSSYSIGVLSKDWTPKENLVLIEEIQEKLLLFSQLKFKWVKGHAGDAMNELADSLATLAIREHLAYQALLTQPSTGSTNGKEETGSTDR